jgi:hypothetical protein
MGPWWRPEHIHKCKERTLDLQHGSISYCYRCNIWLKPKETESHYQDHLNNLDLFCGLRTRKKTVVVAGLSPWDLGKGIYHQFTDRTEFKRQLSQELYNYYAMGQEHLPCPHPRCWEDENGQYTKDGLALHLHDVHGTLDIGHAHTPYEMNINSIITTDTVDQNSSAEGSDLNDESHSPDTLPPTYEDAVRALEDVRNDMDITLRPGVDICTPGSYDWNQSSEKSFALQRTEITTSTDPCIESGMRIDLFSMDAMLLKQYNTNLDVVISLENSPTSQIAGMITSADPLMSQNIYHVESGVHTDQFSMDGMLLQPWNTYLEGAVIDGEKSDSTNTFQGVSNDVQADLILDECHHTMPIDYSILCSSTGL